MTPSDVPGGVLVAYQGFMAVGGVLRRSLGTEPDASVLELEAPPTGLPELVTPPRGKELEDQGEVPFSEADLTVPVAIPDDEGYPPRQLLHVGRLKVLEAAPNTSGTGTDVFRLETARMFVVDTSLNNPEAEGYKTFHVTLKDERMWWGRALLDRWRFNRRDNDGELQADSLNPVTKAEWTLDQLAGYVIGFLPRSPSMVTAPEAWKTIYPSLEYEPYPRAKDVLDDILRRYPARLSLHWDGTVGIYAAEDGRLGYADGGFLNRADLPDSELVEDHLQRGFGYPPKQVVVIGGPRVADVAIDRLEPVIRLDKTGWVVNLYDGLAQLLQDDKVQLLQEALALIKGKTEADKTQRQEIQAQLAELNASGPPKLSQEDRTWLDGFVIRPEAFQTRRGVSSSTLKVLRRDAYKLWRIPGADSYNRHLLPIQNRAASRDGVRLPPLLQTYRWRRRSTPIAGTGAALTTRGPIPTANEQKLAGARSRLNSLSLAINQAIQGTFTAGDVEDKLLGTSYIEQRRLLGAVDSTFYGKDLIGRAISHKRGALGYALRLVIKRLREDPALFREAIDAGLTPTGEAQAAARAGLGLLLPKLLAEAAHAGDLAGAYQQALDDWTAAGSALSAGLFTGDLDVQFALKLIQAGEVLKRDATADAFVQEAVAILGRRASRTLEFKRRLAAGEKVAEEQRKNGAQVYPMAIHLVNDPRLDDPTGKLEDANEGTFRFDAPVGHVDRVDVPDETGRRLVPRAVRAVFGAVLSPRRTPPVTQGLVPWCPLDENADDLIPPQLAGLAKGEDLGTFLRAVDTSGEQAKLQGSALPAGLVAAVRKADLVELILTDGTSNASELERQALDLAAAEAAQAVDLVAGRTVTFDRPWPVNCDGLVSGVEIGFHSKAGLFTRVTLGREHHPFPAANKTVSRKAQQAVPAPPRPEDVRAK